MFGSTASLVPHVRAGRMRAIGVSSLTRNSALPDIPTIAESALPGFESTSWFSLAAPAKTPDAIVKALNDQLTRMAQHPEIVAAVANQGSEIVLMTPEQLREWVKLELAEWKNVVAAAGVKAE